MRFSEIIGHGNELRKLVTMVDEGRLPHALLLHGPSGVGKMQAARALVQYLYCTDRREGDSCGHCPACLQTSKLNNPDVHFVFPIVKTKTRSLSSDYSDEWKEFITAHSYMSPEEWLRIIDAGNSRPMIHVTESEEMIRLSSLSAYGNGYKVFVLWLPEKMNADAANRLLKVIEEPFSDTLFVLVSNNAGEILPTVRSRLQGVEFRPLPDDELIGFLSGKGKSQEEASALARIARGNMNKASQLAESEGESSEFQSGFMSSMRAAYSRNMVELKNLSDAFAGYGREKSLRLLDYFARMIRESFISNLKCASLESMTPGEKTFVARFGPFVNAANVEEIVREIDSAREDISRNANQKIVFFDFLIQLTRLIRTKGAGS